jgi:predicted cation transporter
LFLHRPWCCFNACGRATGYYCCIQITCRLFYLARLIGVDIIIAILALGLIGTFFAKRESGIGEPTEDVEADENIKEVFIRAFKVFVFIFALELLGTGFKPIIDLYIVKMKSELLYWVNTISAIVDNATLAAAEISPSMTPEQIRAILMGMLISGGMLIPGNIPNIISAGKLKIKSTEWARTAVPLGAILLIVYYIVLFVI